MPRTKRSHSPVKVPAGEIFITNDTFRGFNSVVKFKTESGRLGHCNGQIDTNGRGDDCTFTLQTYEEDPVAYWYIPSSRNYGVKFDPNTTPDAPIWDADEEEWILLVSPERTYRLIDDRENSIMTREAFDAITIAFIRFLQRPAPYEALWRTLHQELPTYVVSGRTVVNLERDYDDAFWRYDLPFPYWYNFYPLVRPNIVVPDETTKSWLLPETLQRALVPGGRARVDVYWRGLDRNTGGNVDSDTHTICYTFDCAMQTVSTRVMRHQDEDISRFEYRPAHLSEKISDTSNPNGPFVVFLKALAALGLGDLECTIVEETAWDFCEFDMAWSSHEILVFLPRPWSPIVHQKKFPKSFHVSARLFLLINVRQSDNLKLPVEVVQRILAFAAPLDYVPVARLHQRCIMGPQWIEPTVEFPQEAQPPTDLQRHALQTVQSLVGMGERVNTWSDCDGQPPCAAAQDPKKECVTDNPKYLRFSALLHPLYFDFPARNVATPEQVEEGLTSQQWKGRK